MKKQTVRRKTSVATKPQAASSDRMSLHVATAHEDDDVLTVFSRLDRGEVTFDQARVLLEERRRSKTSRLGRLINCLVK